ncbi:phosphotransferase [Roseiconus nitratireducens]|uniref:Phosphotransferase n=1 Tax=Roseiconus nitratireducens TaxID=2605748 RepID=A0A5M6DE66_9BACT|nr:phosphotransferase [Roseiconus nitratireducens]KAA5544572.1 phosphotransferase [Roseiconus nitratireducens]
MSQAKGRADAGDAAELHRRVCQAVGAESVRKVQPVQSLWSGYGQILRMELSGGSAPASVIVKHIAPPVSGGANPRGWSGPAAHQRKLRSYQVESHWYRDVSSRCASGCRVPKCFAVEADGEDRVLVLEDLDAAGFPLRMSRLDDSRRDACLRWLADFHGTFFQTDPAGLWPVGTYWHLQTRDAEWHAMADGPLKQAAAAIDRRLSACRFQTLVHGDAKVANFCFPVSGRHVAAVDFQYVGGGCGIKDVAYFLGSCLSDRECQQQEAACLDVYFQRLREVLAGAGVDSDLVDAVESEWRALYPWAWADFHRFLCGWCDTHPKLTGYSRRQVDHVLQQLA